MGKEFTVDQLRRMDEVDNEVDNLIRVMLEDQYEDWDYSIIGDVVDMVGEYLTKRGYKVRYPANLYNEAQQCNAIVDYCWD